MTFILYRAWGSSRESGREGETEREERRPDNPGVTDYLFAVLSIVALGYTLVVFDEFVRRAARPETLDLVFGIVTILLVLERSEEHTSELQSRQYLVCRLLLEKKKDQTSGHYS